MDISLASIITVLSSGGLWYLGQLIHKKAKELNECSTANVYSPGLLLKRLNQPEFRENISRNPKNPNEYILNTFVEGYPQSIYPLWSRVDENTKLIYRVSHQKENHTDDLKGLIQSFLIQSPVRIETEAVRSFTLKDPLTGKLCTVNASREVDASGALKKIGEKEKLNNLTPVESALTKLGKSLGIIESAGKHFFSMTGLYIGWTETEFGISLGNALTVYGQVIYDARRKSLRINTPLYYLQEKATLLKALRKEIKGLIGISIFLLVPLVVCGTYLIRRAKNYSKDRIKKIIKEEKEKLIKERFANKGDDIKCVICVEMPRNIILQPCMHFSLCRSCFEKLSSKACPICKKPVDSTLEVEFS